MSSHYDELGYIQEVLEVFQELGGESGVAQLVTPTRRLLHTEDTTLRLHSPTAKERECRIYVFSDLFLVAFRKDKLPKRLSQGSSVVWFGDSRERGSSEASDSSYESDGSSEVGSESSARSDKSSTADTKALFKLKMWMELNKVTPKLYSKDGRHGIYLTYVTMYPQKQKDGSTRWDTQVDRTEIVFKDKESAKRVCGKMQDAIDEMSEKVLRDLEDEKTLKRSDSMSSMGGESVGGESATTQGGGKRKWVKAKKTMEKQRAYSRSSKYSFGSTASQPAGVLTLDDIGDRYKSFNVNAPDEAEAEFTLSFTNPSMGFALSSSEKIGPFICRLVPDGMAELGGVTVGDRITMVNDVEITKDVSWKQCVEIIKKSDKPIRITFVRRQTADEAKANDDQSEVESVAESEAEKEPEEEKETRPVKDEGNTEIKPKKSGKRKWAQKKARKKSYGTRILTMEDLAEQYLDKGAGQRLQDNIDSLFVKMLDIAKPRSNKEYKCIRVLQEIHDTERKYVEHLSATVMDYKRPIKIKTKRVKCKDLKNGKPFCEHRKPQRFCNKLSSKKRVDLVEKRDMDKIFMNVELILKINLHLIQALQNGLKEVADMKEPTVYDLVVVFSGAFEKVTPYFQIYWQYCDEYSNAVTHLAHVQRNNKEFREMLRKLEKKSQTHSLQSMLIQPVQRLCKYPLLFDQLSKSINSYKETFLKGTSDPAKVKMFDKMGKEIEKARESAKKVADKVNAKVGEHQKLQRLAEIYAELGGRSQIKNLIVPWRYHISTTEVAYENKSAKDKEEPELVFCYMFNDLLVLAKPVGNRQSNKRFNKSLTRSLSRSKSRSSIGSTDTRKTSLSVKNKTKNSRSNSRSSVGSNKSSSRRSTSGVPQLDVVKQLQIKGCKNLQKVSEPDTKGRYGFSIHVTETVTKKIVDEDGGKTKTRQDADIWKMIMWLDTEKERDTLLESIEKQKKVLKEDADQFQKIKEKHGIKTKKKNYVRRMRNRNTGSDMSRSHNRTESLKKIQSRKSLNAES